MSDLELFSLQNPRIKSVIKLRKRSVRETEQKVLIEGYREILRAIEGGWPLLEFFYCTELFLGENEEALLEHCREQDTKLYKCSEAVFKKIAYRDRPDGLIAIAPQGSMTFEDLPDLENPFFLVLSGIEKPGNLGTMLRSADGAGVSAVILTDTVTDVFNPNTVRASVGTLFTVPIIETNREDCISWLREQGIAIIATSPDGSKDLYSSKLSGPIALVLGSEMLGLDDGWLKAADQRVHLPMCGLADSLNVSTAAGIFLYEALRQRLTTDSINQVD